MLTRTANSKAGFPQNASLTLNLTLYIIYNTVQNLPVPITIVFHSLLSPLCHFYQFCFPNYILPYTTAKYTRHTHRAPYMQSANKSSLASCQLVKRFFKQTNHKWNLQN